MAEAFLQVLIENLSSLIKKEIGLIMGVDKEMKKLQSTLTTIQSVLEDAEAKQLRNQPIQIWLSKLNHATFEIEDILDECSAELSKLERGDIKFKYLKKILSSRKIGRSLKEIAGRLDDLAAERRNFHLREIVAPQSSEVDCSRETGSILIEPDHVFGRDEDKEKIVDLLVNQVSDCEQLSVIPIIGVGGLGKTSLAQLVFNDQRVSQHFDVKLWVCVSDNFDCKILLEAMIVSATGKASGLVQLDALQRYLWEVLSQKRYLLILDDAWNDNQEDWAKLKSILECGSKGAAIVVTTRLRKVADIMGTLPFHSLEGLSEKDLWLLFKLRAFGQESEAPLNLETIGRQIVKKCSGVPLAAKALGGLLRFKRNENEWIHVSESEIWNLPEEEAVIMPALRLSYHHLPLELRRCFAYCAVFPKDSEMEKQDLIFCWMAHGCISSNGVQEVEDIGDKIWNELVVRSIFQQVSEEGIETTFKMHDLVHDLAQSIMENKVEMNSSSSKVREVHFGRYSEDCCSSISLKVPTLTTINNYTRLRILKLNDESVENLPMAIGKLKHLRYLDLSRSNICSLHPIFSTLWNLQILNLRYCHRLRSLPKDIRYMTNLRHIFLYGCRELSDMPPGIGELTSLKTLDLFLVGHEVGNRLDQLELLNLGGRLQIRHLERARNHVYGEQANLVEKPNLRELKLHWEAVGDLPCLKFLSMSNLTRLEYIVHHNEIRGAALFPSLVKLTLYGLTNLRGLVNNEVHGEMIMLQNLRELTIKNCSPQSVSSFSKAKLENLTKLELAFSDIVNRCTEQDAWEGLSNLRELCVSGAGEGGELTERWFGGLKSLKKLEIEHCKIGASVLEGWLRHITALESLKISDCSELYLLPEEIKHLHLLKCLDLLFLRNMVSLPQGLGLQLQQLQSLRLFHLPKLTSLPEWFGNLTSLTDLQISECPILTSLPSTIHGMSSLKSLFISRCPQLTSLPSTIQAMSNLKRLSIARCPELEKQCQKEKGEDWHKVAHISELTFAND
ncbi:hypothetical protein C2S52_014157 [Perilla frutescens var. hirtella]|nr:hypothetical protein C2S52_014157 [Perilla frutescens var. hirtella]